MPSSSALPEHLRGLDLTRMPTSRHVVALTFDAGGNADGVPAILAVLAREKVPATFFLTGAWTRVFPAAARDIAARYPVGNHTMTHPHFLTLSDADVQSELGDARTLIRTVAGRDPFPLFRFPYGERDAHDISVVNGLGYVPIRWTVDTLGWQGTTQGRTVASVVQRVRFALQPGEIVLMHVGSHPTDRSTLDADALPEVIAAVRAAGYGFVTVPEGLGLP